MDVRENILYFHTDEIQKTDILWGLLELGYPVDCPKREIKLSSYTEEDLAWFVPFIETCSLVITQNFSLMAAEGCFRANVPYLSWIYDSPQKNLYRKEAKYPTNYIFAFDKKQVERLKQLDLTNVFYQPLAANITQAGMLSVTDEDMEKYESDISFVGQMYHRSYYTKFMESAPPKIRMDFEKVLDQLCCNWAPGVNIFGHLSKETIHHVYEVMEKKDLDLYQMDTDYLVEVLMLSGSIANRERTTVLSELSKYYKTTLYTKETDRIGNLGNVIVRPPVNYEDEMYKVFFSGKINLNLTMRAIETGVPQRVFDIMAVGGFVLSNYQEELEELFVPDKEIVLFRNLQELKQKAAYYLSHEKERIRIAIAGYQKVREKYNYANSLSNMIALVENREEKRKNEK